MRYYWPARGNELQIDLDKTTLGEFHRRLGVLRGLALVKITGVKEQASKTAGHWHVTVTLSKALDPMERILLQCALGSDPVRELLNWARVRKQDAVPILFIEPMAREREEEVGAEEDNLSYVFDPEFDDEPECLACECELGAGRCKHMEEFQPSIQFVKYGEDH